MLGTRFAEAVVSMSMNRNKTMKVAGMVAVVDSSTMMNQTKRAAEVAAVVAVVAVWVDILPCSTATGNWAVAVL